jgi:hypothetical protein
MDQIMRDARMFRLALPDLFQNRRALELIGVGLVRRRRGDIQRDAI